MKFNNISNDYLEQLVKGAFLTAKKDGKVNVMTIGWGTIGYIWNKPVLMVPVRYSRHTYEFMKDAEHFTVSVPLKGHMKEELAYCGTRSGRDVDKVKELGLELYDGIKTDVPVIGNGNLQIECRVVYKQAMEPNLLSPEIDSLKYPDGDYHVMYYGEILSIYEK